MASRIEDYAVIGDTQTAALVGRDGSIDRLCLPRFDSGACFVALLGTPATAAGCWRRRALRPASGGATGATLALETEFTTSDGVVRVVDFMPPRETVPDLVRLVQGVEGRMPTRCELVVRFDYGRTVPGSAG